MLRSAVLKWPANGLEADDKGFKVLVEDPFVRDILKTYADRCAIVLDGSFSSENWETRTSRSSPRKSACVSAGISRS